MSFIIILAAAALVVLGFLAGKFLALGLLITITVICALAVILLNANAQELPGGMITALSFVGTLVFNVPMWVTYYVVTGQTWFGEFFKLFLR